MSRILRVLLAGALLLLTSPVVAWAQLPRGRVSGTLVLTRLDTEVVPLGGQATNESFTGLAYGFEGALPLWKLELGLRYINGSLDNGDGNVDLDFVEGEVFLGLRPLPWVVLKAGPHARSFKTVAGVERWLFWEIRARAEAGLLSPRLGTYFEFWGALVGDVNFGRSFGSGRGAEAGLTYELGSVPLWGRLGYRVDRGTVGGGSRFDSVQEVLIGIGYGWR